MHILKLKLKKCSYNIIIGSDILSSLPRYIRKLSIGPDAYIISNKAVKKRYGYFLNKALKEAGFSVKFRLIPDTEKSKSIKMASLIIKDMASYDRKRHLFIIAFGGGVIGDLAGFIAAIYKRGVSYLQAPTTLLAQVDSSIGGKTAVDLREGKNLIGAFYQPRLVFTDVGLLRTLGARQIRAGLAEVIKYAIIKDPKLFRYLEEKHRDIFNLKPAALEFIVRRCASIKAKVVQEDEREEKGIRTILNFGHTLGHAIEAAGNFKNYNHGEAVALGLLLASDISKDLKLVGNQTVKRIENLVRIMGLPLKIKRISLSAIIKAHYRDKKFIGAKNKFVLIKKIGKTKIAKNIPLGVIKRVLNKRISVD